MSPVTLVKKLVRRLHQKYVAEETVQPDDPASWLPWLRSATSQDISLEESTSNLFNFIQSRMRIITDAWLHSFVINSSPEKEWHFRTLFVAEVTVLPFVLAFIIISFWLLNRNTHIHKTKGSTISRRDGNNSRDESTADDDEDDESTTNHNVAGEVERGQVSNGIGRKQDKKSRRHTIQAMLKAYDVENDDEDATILSIDMSVELEDSDWEDDEISTNSSISPMPPSSVQVLSKEKRSLFKIVREIPIFSYLNEEAIQMCMQYVEYVDVGGSDGQTPQRLWDQNHFDGSLYYIVSGRVHVYFHDFAARPQDRTKTHNELESAVKVVHDAGTVVTSALSMMEGMVRCYLRDKKLVDRFLDLPIRRTSAYTDGQTTIIRVPSKCFAMILDRFPETILRIVQTALNRTQRVTVQTLVRTCGLREELLVPLSHETQSAIKSKESKPWRSVQEHLKSISSESNGDPFYIPDIETKDLVKTASIALAHFLSIRDESTITVLQEECDVIIMQPHDDPQRRILFEAGSIHEYCYFLLNGEMELGLHIPREAFSSQQQLRSNPTAWKFHRKELMQPGALIGESACFTTDVNLFEVRSIGKKEAVLLRIPKDIFSQILVKHPQAVALTLISILSVLSPVVHFLTWTTEWMHVEAAEEIAHRGEACNSIFVVLNGRLRAQQGGKNRHRAMGGTGIVAPPEEFGRGKIIGEIEALAGGRWPYDVFAIRQSELAKVPIATLEAVVHNFPSAGLFLARSVASHVESMNSSNRKRWQQSADANLLQNNGEMTPDAGHGNSTIPTAQSLPNVLPSYGLKLATIAVVPLTYNVDLKRFCGSLIKAMTTIAPCKLLTKSFIKEEMGEKAWQNRSYPLHDLKLTRLLADMEENNRVVVYEADPKYTFWTRLCIRQADCILLVVDSHQAPEQSRVEQTLDWAYQAMDVRIDLVVVGEGEASSEDLNNGYDDFSYYDDDDMSVSDQLNNWSESRKWIAGHHLVRTPFERYRMDFRRMCRRISGRAVGLVLGGGGARGLGHLGVIRALTEAGVTVDMVGGTSQGAFCGALFARYPDDFDKVVEASRGMASEMCSVTAKLFDLTLPLASMFTGRSFNRCIRKLLGKLRIQDLVLNFFCVSVDLVSQNAIIHTKGLLWKYVRASMTLAGYLPPVADNGSLLVDGGYLNAIPADIMKYKMGAQVVIAVDVLPENKREYFAYGTHLSGWWLLYNSWNPFVTTVKVPSMGDISEMIVWVSSDRHRKSVRMASDLHLTPPVSDVGTLEYDRFDEVVEKSYEYAKPLVAEFVQKNPWLVPPQRPAKSTETKRVK